MMRTLHIALLAVVLAFAAASGAANAVQPDEILPDAAMEAEARAISAELRCLVCQNQSIDDSDASLARDLRLIVRERLKAGDDRNQVYEYLVARYGEFVLLRPRLNRHTWLLWGAPVLLLAVGGTLAFAVVSGRGGRKDAGAQPLSDAEKAKLAKIMDAERG